MLSTCWFGIANYQAEFFILEHAGNGVSEVNSDLRDDRVLVSGSRKGGNAEAAATTAAPGALETRVSSSTDHSCTTCTDLPSNSRPTNLDRFLLNSYFVPRGLIQGRRKR